MTMIAHTADDTPEADRIEAQARKLMAAHAATPARGFDSERKRALLRAEIDALLDDWAASRG